MDWIISDIHGCSITLNKLLDKILHIDSNPRFIFNGDYLDRGLHSKQVVDTILSISPDYDVILLRGNHDDVFDYILNDHSMVHMSKVTFPPYEPEQALMWGFQFGMIETCFSYGLKIKLSMPVEHVLKELRKECPDSHKNFYKNLQMYWKNDTHFVCHAYYEPLSKLPHDLISKHSDLSDSMLWNRFNNDEIYSDTIWQKIGVFGHTPVSYYNRDQKDIIYGKKIRLIDTGCCSRGRLTAYCCQTDSFVYEEMEISDKYPKSILES